MILRPTRPRLLISRRKVLLGLGAAIATPYVARAGSLSLLGAGKPPAGGGAGGGGAIAFVQQASNGGALSTFSGGGSIAFGAAATAGNSVVIFVRDYCAGTAPHFVTISSVSDTAGNTYSLSASYTGSDPAVRAYVAQNVTGGFTTVTVNVSTALGGTGYWFIWGGEYSGTNKAGSAVDAGASGATNGAPTTSLTSSAITTAGSAEAIVMAGSQNAFADYTAGTNFIMRNGTITAGTDHLGGVQDYITTGILSSYTAGMTSSVSAQFSTAWVALKT